MIVLKFGGSSLASVNQIKNVAKKVVQERKTEKKIVVVVSAMGKTTDNLIEEANAFGKNISKSVLDRLLNLGELKSVFLLTLALDELNEKVCALNGGEAGIIVGGNFGNGFIKSINTNIIDGVFKKHDIVVVAGFCGKTEKGEVITLGRGGSDTTAVALASAFNCKCTIYTDVCAISTLDPRIFADAKKYNKINFDDMLEFSAFGAKVLETRCVEIAKKNKTEICLTKKNSKNKTIISDNFENLGVCGIGKVDNIGELNLIFNKEKSGDVFNLLKENVSKIFMLDMIFNEKEIKLKIAIFNIELQNIAEKLQKIAKSVSFKYGLAIVTIIGFGWCCHVQNLIEMLFLTIKNNIKFYKTSQTERVFNILCNEKDALDNMRYLKELLNL